jgi:hypothetical protein
MVLRSLPDLYFFFLCAAKGAFDLSHQKNICKDRFTWLIIIAVTRAWPDLYFFFLCAAKGGFDLSLQKIICKDRFTWSRHDMFSPFLEQPKTHSASRFAHGSANPPIYSSFFCAQQKVHSICRTKRLFATTDSLGRATICFRRFGTA